MFWQTSLIDSAEIPHFDQLLKVLVGRSHALTVTYNNSTRTYSNPVTPSNSRLNVKYTKPVVALHTAASSADNKRRPCPLYQKGHYLGYCPRFKSLNTNDRLSKAKALKVYLNCLSMKHLTKACPSQATCQIDDCKQKHHFLLNQGTNFRQPPGSSTTEPQPPPTTNPTVKPDVPSVSIFNTVTSRHSVLLGTAWGTVENQNGEKMNDRALLDHAAEASFISERVAQLLRVHRTKVIVPTAGLQGTPTGEAKALAQVKLRSPQLVEFSLPWTVLILPNVSSILPAERVTLKRWKHLVTFRFGMYFIGNVYCILDVYLLNRIRV